MLNKIEIRMTFAQWQVMHDQLTQNAPDQLDLTSTEGQVIDEMRAIIRQESATAYMAGYRDGYCWGSATAYRVAHELLKSVQNESSS